MDGWPSKEKKSFIIHIYTIITGTLLAYSVPFHHVLRTPLVQLKIVLSPSGLPNLCFHSTALSTIDSFKAHCRSKRKLLQISWLILANIADRSQEGKEQKGKKPSFLTCDPAATVGAKYCRMQDPPEFWAHGKPGGHAIQERLISLGHPTPTTQMDVEAERSFLSG